MKIEPTNLFGQREDDIWQSAYDAGKAAERERCLAWWLWFTLTHFPQGLLAADDGIRSGAPSP